MDLMPLKVRGRIASRTVKVSRTIDQPQLPSKSPSRPCQKSRTALQASISCLTTGMIAISIGARGLASGIASGPRHSRILRYSGGCSGGGASRRAPRRGAARTGGPLLRRTQSPLDSTYTAARWPGTPRAGRRGSARPLSSEGRSCCVLTREAGIGQELAQGFLDALFAAVLREAPGIRPGDDHEVVTTTELVGGGPEGFPQEALDSVALHGAAELPSHRDAEPGRTAVLRPWEGVQHQIAAGVRPALAVDPLELATARQTAPPAPSARAAGVGGHG